MSRVISIHQPCFLPWMGFFSKLISSDIFVILDHVQFVKDEYDNRVKIKTERGAVWITVPIFKKHRSIQIFKDTEIDNSTNWGLHLIRVISNAYSKAPFFGDYWHVLEQTFNRKWKWLLELNIHLINTICKIISVETKIVQSSELPLKDERASELNLKIVKLLNGNIYLSGAMGKDYLIEKDFEQENIIVLYQNNNYPTYQQQWSGFLPGLSLIDFLFNSGANQVKIALTNSRSSATNLEAVLTKN